MGATICRFFRGFFVVERDSNLFIQIVPICLVFHGVFHALQLDATDCRLQAAKTLMPIIFLQPIGNK